MKKFLITLLVLTMILTCVACKSDTGGKEGTPPPAGNSTPENGDPDNGKDNEPGKENKSSANITMEELMTYPESPESDFACSGGESIGYSIMRYDGDDEVVVIPEKIKGIPVVKIDSYVFANTDAIKAVRLSDSVTEIASAAFGGSTGLELFASGSGLEIIDKSVFLNCESLKEVRLNEGLRSIGASAFGFCTSLDSVSIPSSVEDISQAPFVGMSDEFKVIIEQGSVLTEDAEELAELGYMKVEYR